MLKENNCFNHFCEYLQVSDNFIWVSPEESHLYTVSTLDQTIVYTVYAFCCKIKVDAFICSHRPDLELRISELWGCFHLNL